VLHRFNDVRGKLSTSAREFTEQMEYLAVNGYNVVALRDLPAILRGESPMPPKAVAITIDDGYRSTYEVAFPILVRYGFPATLFLYSDMAGLPAGMTWAQMRDLIASGLIDVLAHSKSHSTWRCDRPTKVTLPISSGCGRRSNSPVARSNDDSVRPFAALRIRMAMQTRR
jgi:peptidoglycan/xylan/chitin deacetylase (PgdA/CDA1 family)